jgi:hypothetical protein
VTREQATVFANLAKSLEMTETPAHAVTQDDDGDGLPF